MKTEFYLTPTAGDYRGVKIDLISKKPGERAYITFGYSDRHFGTLAAADLERLAVNILKALGSKKLFSDSDIRTKINFKPSKKKK
jgi:hypothetical protein